METPQEYNAKEIKWILEESKPLTVREWEGMHIDAEFPSVGLSIDAEETQELAKSVLKLSSEIRRLRHKCGEEVWYGISQDEQACEEERQAYKQRNEELF